jgi:hypothetical protein
MRITRKIALLAFTAITAMVFAASTAAAQTVQIVQEDNNNQHCPAAPNSTTGGCVIHGAGEILLIGHVFGIEATASDCNVDFEARIDEDGEGYIYSAGYSGDATHNCTRTPCRLPWRMHVEELGGGLIRLRVEWCARPTSGGDNVCLHDVPILDDNDHNIHFIFDDLGGIHHVGSACELTSGIVTIETGTQFDDAPHREIEIVHTP